MITMKEKKEEEVISYVRVRDELVDQELALGGTKDDVALKVEILEDDVHVWVFRQVLQLLLSDCSSQC